MEKVATPLILCPKPLVVVAGTFQRGKSTLINGLIGHAVAEVGEGIATTHGWTRFRSGQDDCIEAVAPDGHLVHRWNSSSSAILSHVDLADIPGFDAGGSEGVADALAAEEALAQADIVLHVTNQTGLGGETERTVLSRLRANQPIVIALQNVFVRSSASKKAQWLALLEKQLSDIGVHTWCLSSGSRALTINALRLAEVTTTGIGDGISPEEPESQAQIAKWRKESGLEPLVDFLYGSDPNGLSAMELCAVRRASESWASQRRASANRLFQSFAKPCN